MIVPAQAWNPTAEAELLGRVKAAYEARGFSVVVQPGHGDIPSFLGGVRPDAIARKDAEGIVIEVKRRGDPRPEGRLAELRRVIAAQSGWKLDVIFAVDGPEEAIAIPSARLESLHRQITEVTELKQAGHTRAAFMLAWSVLEAALNRLGGDASSRPRSAGTLVQSLAIAGYVDGEAERRLRELSDLRNRVVHGDLESAPSSADVEQVLAAVDETLVVEPG